MLNLIALRSLSPFVQRLESAPGPGHHLIPIALIQLVTDRPVPVEQGWGTR